MTRRLARWPNTTLLFVQMNARIFEKTEIEYVSKAALRADVVRSLFQIGVEQLINKSAGELTIEAWDVSGRRIVAGNLTLKVQS